jgi:hypothetical protein
MLICDRANIRSAAVSGIMTRRAMSRIASQAGINFEIYAVDREASLRCHVLGSAKGLFDSGFTSEQCRRVPFPQSSFGLGLGAFGADFKECQPRFGEFLAVQGAAAQLPTHSFGVPDYILASERLVPEVEVLYGMKCEGEFARCCRFLPTEQTETVKFCNLVEQCLSLGETQLAGFVMIAECAGLVGASLRRSPAVRTSAVGSRFQYPEIRDWISFSSDQVHRHSIAVVVGIATKERPRDGASALAPFLRPLGDGDNVLGHFHAAVFPYRPLKKRSLDLHDSVMTLFDSGTLQGVVHLLNDRRPVSGAGESEFLGGGCWIAPIGEVVAESNAA